MGISNFEDFINEARSITKIDKDIMQTVDRMAELVTNWKAAKQSGDKTAEANFVKKLKILTDKKIALNKELDISIGLKDVHVEFVGEDFINEDWGSSDQHSMNMYIHDLLKKPKTMPSPIDDNLKSAAEDAVDYYWEDWPEYKKERNTLILNAIRLYLQKMFTKEFNRFADFFK